MSKISRDSRTKIGILFGLFLTGDEHFLSFRVKSIKDLQMNVNLCDGKFHGRVHVTHICDDVTQVNNI